MTATRAFALHLGGDVCDHAVFDPFDARVGQRFLNPYHAFVIEHPTGRVLVDTGAHPALVADPAARLGPKAADMDVRVDDEHQLLPRLAGLGLEPGSIDVVIQTHLHFDHAGGLEHFAGGPPVLVHPDELAFASDPPFYQDDVYAPADFDHPLDWTPVADGHDVLGDGSIVCVHTPGHTPGHLSVLVRLPGRAVFLLGDAAYDVGKMRARRLPAVVWNPDALGRTWELIEAIEADTGALLVATHDRDHERVMPAGPDAWWS